jgi:Cytochrome C oxidase, cbb3-type, subunit III
LIENIPQSPRKNRPYPWNFAPKRLQNVKEIFILATASVNSQLTTPKSPYRLLLVAIGLCLTISALILGFHRLQLSNPYIHEVFSLSGNAGRGYEIFQINCAGCHGKFADGIVGPSLHEVSRRKSKVSLIEQVVSGNTPPMPKFQPDPQEMADLLIYLENL